MIKKCNFRKSSGFAKLAVLILLAFVMLLSVTYVLSRQNKNRPDDLPVDTLKTQKKQALDSGKDDNAGGPKQNPALGNQTDKRACISDEVLLDLDSGYLSEFLVGKAFVNYTASGEQGIFKGDGSLPVTWGRDYVPNDTRPSSRVARWSVSNGELTISESSLTDGVYRNFRAYRYKGDVYAIPKDGGSSLFVGLCGDDFPNCSKLRSFYTERYLTEICQ